MLREKVIRKVKYKFAVIGLGNIGMGYDYQSASKDLILTHASSAHYHPSFQLVAGVDVSPHKRNLFKERYQCQAYESIDAMFEAQKPDVIALALPTAFHATAFFELINWKPKLILCEKPIAAELAVAEEMIEAAQENDILLAVNYMRRFDPEIRKLKQKINEGIIGKVYKVVAYYSKGLLNNGSHLIDLLFYLLSENCVSNVKVINKGRSFNADIEPDIYFSLGEINVCMLAAREECFSYLQINIIGTEGVIKYDAGENIEISTVKNDLIYSDYQILNDASIKVKTEIKKSQWHVLSHLANVMQHKENLVSSGTTAIASLAVIDMVKQQIGSV
jgi:predicted dehydrogenase